MEEAVSAVKKAISPAASKFFLFTLKDAKKQHQDS
jgi:hypothetical protein